MARGRPLSLLACAVLAALALGCGGDGEDGGALGKLRAAARENDDLGLRYYLRVTAKTGSHTDRFRGYGQVEAGGRRSRVVSTNTEGKAHELVRDGAYLYANIVPGVDKSGGGVWIKLKASGSGQDDENLGALALFDAFSPTAALALLLGLDPEVKQDGEEFVGDIHTQRYRVSVKRGPLADEFSKRGGAKQFKLAGAAREQVIPAVVWIDGQGRVRRARVRLGDAAESLVVMSQATAYDDITVRVPSGSNIVDGTD